MLIILFAHTRQIKYGTAIYASLYATCVNGYPSLSAPSLLQCMSTHAGLDFENLTNEEPMPRTI